MKIQNNCKLSLNMFKLAYGLFLAYSFFGHIEIINPILKGGTFLAILLLVINFLIQYNKCLLKEFTIYILLIILSLITAYYNNDFGFFKLMLLAGSIRKICFREVIRFDMKLRVGLLIILLMLFILGIAPDIRFTYNGLVRYSLGFLNPNSLGLAVFILACDILYLANMKMNAKLMILLSGLAYFLFLVARSRSAVYLIILLMILAVIYRVLPMILYSGVIKIIYYATPILLSIATLVVVEAFINNVSYALEINRILSGRVETIAIFSNILSPSFFGQEIGDILQRSLDNTFAFIWYNLGILMYFGFVFAYIRVIRINLNNKDVSLCIIMSVFLLYGLTEHLWINVDYNVFMLAFFYSPSKWNTDYTKFSEKHNDRIAVRGKQ